MSTKRPTIDPEAQELMQLMQRRSAEEAQQKGHLARMRKLNEGSRSTFHVLALLNGAGLIAVSVFRSEGAHAPQVIAFAVGLILAFGGVGLSFAAPFGSNGIGRREMELAVLNVCLLLASAMGFLAALAV